MTREALLAELKNETYVMLKPSGIHGIGVFATRPIPKGCRNIFSKGVGEWIKLPIADVELLPQHAKVFVIPDGGLNNLNFETFLVSGPKLHFWIEDVAIANVSSLQILDASHAGENPNASRKHLGRRLFVRRCPELGS